MTNYLETIKALSYNGGTGTVYLDTRDKTFSFDFKGRDGGNFGGTGHRDLDAVHRAVQNGTGPYYVRKLHDLKKYCLENHLDQIEGWTREEREENLGEALRDLVQETPDKVIFNIMAASPGIGSPGIGQVVPALRVCRNNGDYAVNYCRDAIISRLMSFCLDKGDTVNN